MFATRGSPSRLSVGDEAAYPSRTPRLKPAHKPGSRRAHGRPRSWAESGQAGKGTRPDMGSWMTQAARRRITRTDTRVTTQPHQPAGSAEPAGILDPGRPAGARPYRPGCDQELLHHRAHRSRKVDAGRPDAAVHRGGRRPPDAGPVP